MGTRDTYHKTLLRACILAGDESALANKLGVGVSEVVDWLLGDKPVPTEIFLRAVDVVITSHRKQVQDNRAFLEAIKRRHRR